MNMMKMMAQAQKAQAQMQKMQAELSAKEYSAESGGGMVKVVANGGGGLVSLKINPEVVKADDVEMLEDLILTAAREAVELGRKDAEVQMKKMMSGLGLPPGLF